MIAVRHEPTTPPRGLNVPGVARAAIARGILRGDAVAQLEYLGFSPRYMNLLENSRLNIITLKQLVSRSREELLDIPGFGESALQQLLGCLARYHELESLILRRDAAEAGLAPVGSGWFGADD